MSFNPCNRTMKIQESIWDSNSQHWSSLGSVRAHSLTLFALSGACDVTFGSPSWPATLQPLALIASPRLGLRQCGGHETSFFLFFIFLCQCRGWEFVIKVVHIQLMKVINFLCTKMNCIKSNGLSWCVFSWFENANSIIHQVLLV